MSCLKVRTTATQLLCEFLRSVIVTLGTLLKRRKISFGWISYGLFCGQLRSGEIIVSSLKKNYKPLILSSMYLSCLGVVWAPFCNCSLSYLITQEQLFLNILICFLGFTLFICAVLRDFIAVERQRYGTHKCDYSFILVIKPI